MTQQVRGSREHAANHGQRKRREQECESPLHGLSRDGSLEELETRSTGGLKLIRTQGHEPR